MATLMDMIDNNDEKVDEQVNNNEMSEPVNIEKAFENLDTETKEFLKSKATNSDTVKVRYFYNPEDNDLVIHQFINGKWIFHRLTNSIPVEIDVNELDKFEEIDLEKFISLIKPVSIKSFPPRDPTEIKSLPKLIETTEEIKAENISKIIENNFGKHDDFSSTNAVVSSQPLNETDLEKIKNAVGTTEPITSLEKAFDDIEDAGKKQEINDLFKVVSFLRSYVDLYHDILEKGSIYAEQLSKLFKNQVYDELTPKSKILYDKYINFIKEKSNTKITTATGNINQTRCKQIVETLTDDFIKELHLFKINWIPLTKENAFVKSINLKNESEFKELVDILKEDGVDTFFVESSNSKLGSKLIEKKFKIVDLSIGSWDAGTGLSGSDETTTILIGPNKENGGTLQLSKKPKKDETIAVGGAKRKRERLPSEHILLPNTPLNMFGVLDVSVSSNNEVLTFSTVKEPVFESTIKNGPIKLSVNSIMKTIGEPIVRGDEDTKVIQIIPTTPQINRDSVEQKSYLVSLKTWTDLIQIASISESKVIKDSKGTPLKIATVIYDGLCETTARLYGLGHVLKTESNIITYYNYDINSRRLTSEQIAEKLRVQNYIKKHKDDIFEPYLNNWFNNKIEALYTIENHVYSPALYFTAILFKTIYETNKKEALQANEKIGELDIKLVPKSINEYIEGITSSESTLGSLLDYLSKFKDAIKKVLKLRPRSSLDDFEDAYASVQQQIVNTFGDSDEITLRSMVAATFAYAFITRPRFEQFFTALNSIKAAFEKNRKDIRNIQDIEIAFQVMITEDITYSNNISITYMSYIQTMNTTPEIFGMPEQFAFKNRLEKVKTAISSGIVIGGGGSIRRKTRRQRKYFKTMRALKHSNVTSSKTHRKKITKRPSVKRFSHTRK